MKRIIIVLTVAVASAAALRAQEVKSTTTTKVEDGKAVIYTGCLQNTTEKTYVLENAVPMKETKTETKVGAGGMPETTTTTTTKYVLVPGGTVNFEQNVGHKVEVTAALIPAGDDKSKIRTETKTEVEGGKDSKTENTEKVAQTSTPQLRVISMRHLSDRCSPRP
jgi:cobalamin-dependent methionine synthase I